jgi:predicted Rossmann-fold nucleotide-binding protein
MAQGYEINELAKEDSWRMFRIIGELVEGFDSLTGVEPAVSIYGSARVKEGDALYVETQEVARRLGEMGFSIITGGGPGIMEAANRGACEAGVTSVGLNIRLPEEQEANRYATRSTLMQTHTIRPFPVVLFDSQYWQGFLDWLENSSLARGLISEEDFDLLRVCDGPDSVIEVIREWYQQHQLIGRRAVER